MSGGVEQRRQAGDREEAQPGRQRPGGTGKGWAGEDEAPLAERRHGAW